MARGTATVTDPGRPFVRLSDDHEFDPVAATADGRRTPTGEMAPVTWCTSALTAERRSTRILGSLHYPGGLPAPTTWRVSASIRPLWQHFGNIRNSTGPYAAVRNNTQIFESPDGTVLGNAEEHYTGWY